MRVFVFVVFCLCLHRVTVFCGFIDADQDPLKIPVSLIRLVVIFVDCDCFAQALVWHCQLICCDLFLSGAALPTAINGFACVVPTLDCS